MEVFNTTNLTSHIWLSTTHSVFYFRLRGQQSQFLSIIRMHSSQEIYIQTFFQIKVVKF